VVTVVRVKIGIVVAVIIRSASMHGRKNLGLTVPEVTDQNKNIIQILTATTIYI
jgi:hypothetical protein